MQHIKISVRLYLSLGLILMALASMVWISVTHSDALWLQTKRLYEHPLTVRRAVGSFETGITAMQRDVRGLFVAGSGQEVEALLAKIDAEKLNAFRQLDILEERYLGPPEDISAIRAELVKLNAIHGETIRLLRRGKRAEAAARTKLDGIGTDQAEVLYECTGKVDDFARGKGDQFYRDATLQMDRLTRRLYLFTGAVLIFTLLISYFLVRWIRSPLKQLSHAADRFRQGDLKTRTGMVSRTEFGVLAASFDAMADTVEAEMRLREKASRLADAMGRETEAGAFCREMLAVLLDVTGSQVGAVYLLNPEQRAYEHFESIGLSSGGRAAFSADTREGEFGAALATGKVRHISAIPDDTPFTLATVTGEFRPREIITVPVPGDEGVLAVVSLASIRPYDAGAVQLVEDAFPAVTARLNGVLLFRRIQDLAGRLEAQNRELEAQKAELTAQAAELSAMNAELETQSRQVMEADRLKSAFLANMSHELRTPLNSVIALSGVLGRRLAGRIPEDEYGYLDIIERNGNHLLTLINDILDLSRIEAGHEVLTPGVFAVREIVETVTEMLEPLAREKGLFLVNRVGDDLPPLCSDPEKVRHILQNLAGNAVKFTDVGSVEITARRSDDDLHIAVRDTGIGIPEGSIPHIFDEFRQADDSASRRYGGTGLGLAIARRYARFLGGDISVESVPGQGSTFTVRLPLKLSGPADGERRPGAGARPSPASVTGAAAVHGGRSILLVEDSEPIVIQMTEILAEQGYEVRTAKNGVEALVLIGETMPDGVILDLMMPEMDGFEVLRTIRGTERTAALPVLILTARQVTREELAFLTCNHIHQLIRKGGVGREALLDAVAGMFAPPVAETAEERPEPTRKPGPGRPVVLVVEDNPDNLRTMQALLRDTCTVIEARDGQAGVAEARRRRPDLILMDLALPVMDGYDALAAIREDPTLGAVPVVAVTASAMKGDREAILARGFDGYLSKPIDGKLLIKVINEAIHGKA